MRPGDKAAFRSGLYVPPGNCACSGGVLQAGACLQRSRLGRPATLFALILTLALFGMAAKLGLASAISPPQYYVFAQVVESKAVRGGLHAVTFVIKGLVPDQKRYGGYSAPAALADELVGGRAQVVQFAPNPALRVEVGETIVVGVIHGSSMGVEGALPWTMFGHPYRVDGTPIGLHYPARN